MEKWIPLKEASVITGRPERTLRHYAVEGKIQVKKEGRFWLCNIASLQKMCLVKRDTAPKVVAVFPAKYQQGKPLKTEGTRKGRRLSDLGVYSELMAFYLSLSSKNAALPHLRQGIDELALGYYEFGIARKLEYFRSARVFLVKALVAFQMEKNTEAIPHLEDSIIPGTSGLIRRMEKMGERTHATR